MKEGPHISIKPEAIFTLNGFPVTNSLFSAAIVLVVFLVISVLYWIESKRKNKSMFFYLVTFALRSTYMFFKSVFGDKINYFYPLVGTFFFFILFHNWFGLLPGVGSILVPAVGEHGHEMAPLLRGDTTDLNTTFSLALISILFSQYVGVKHLGLIGYLKKFINLKSPIAFFTGIMETISEFSKVISFSFRLFGNIFAGEVIITIMALLVPVLASFPFLLFEVFIGLIQALVFSMLSAVFFSMAMEKAH